VASDGEALVRKFNKAHGGGVEVEVEVEVEVGGVVVVAILPTACVGLLLGGEEIMLVAMAPAAAARPLLPAPIPITIVLTTPAPLLKTSR
jgi:hypothetical protein